MNRETASHSRAILPLIELLTMMLVFMLAAAVCVRAFVYADQLSAHSAARDRALNLAQTGAEVMKAAGGPYRQAAEALAAKLGEDCVDGGTGEDSVLIACYDKDWNPTKTAPAYYLYVQALRGELAPTDAEGLTAARVWVWASEQEETLAELCFAWQTEVTDRG